MVVFSLSDRASFDRLPAWLSDAKTQARADIALLLVGNKSDLCEERTVSVVEASRLAQREGCAYIEASARTGESVEAAFFKLARTVLAKIHDGSLDAAALVSRGAAAGGAAAVGRKDDAAAAATGGAAGSCSC